MLGIFGRKQKKWATIATSKIAKRNRTEKNYFDDKYCYKINFR